MSGCIYTAAELADRDDWHGRYVAMQAGVTGKKNRAEYPALRAMKSGRVAGDRPAPQPANYFPGHAPMVLKPLDRSEDSR